VRHRKPPLAFRANPVVTEVASAHTEQRVGLRECGIDAQRRSSAARASGIASCAGLKPKFANIV
jgi:hypothetical protein